MALTNNKETSLPDISSLSISSLQDYPNYEFPGKELQKEKIIDLIDAKGCVPEDLIENEVNWFYDSLNLNNSFFMKFDTLDEKSQDLNILSNIIISLYLAKIDSTLLSQSNDDINESNESTESTTTTTTTTTPSISPDPLKLKINKSFVNQEKGYAIFLDTDDTLDNQIDHEYLDSKKTSNNYKLEAYVSSQYNLKITIIESVPTTNDNSNNNKSTTFSPNNEKLYTLLKLECKEREGPTLKFLKSLNDDIVNEYRLIIAYEKNSTSNFYQSLFNLFKYYDIKPNKIYMDVIVNDLKSKLQQKLVGHQQFEDDENLNIFSIYFNQSDNPSYSTINDFNSTLTQILKESSLLYCLPSINTQVFNTKNQKTIEKTDSNTIGKLFENDPSPQEITYAYIGSIFINHFIDRFQNLGDLSNQHLSVDLLEILKKNWKSQSYSQTLINNVLAKHQPIVSRLFKNFALIHYPSTSFKNSTTTQHNTAFKKTLSYQRIVTGAQPFANDKDFENYLNKVIDDQTPDYLILKTLNLFNKSILKTNFFINKKIAISFRLDPKTIFQDVCNPLTDEIPFGLFMVVGSSFKGFHIRFRDIARGGIRIVTSKNSDVYELNSNSVLEENFNLASTQQKKNKDIPEGGSKGVILMNPTLSTTNDTFHAFKKYVDSIIDILIDDDKKSLEKYADLYGKQEILFFGPDEGTAPFVDWATLHAKKRNCPWWKSFLTGKSPKLGGIPHDEFGMTTLGVRSFVENIYDEEKLWDSKLFKLQTGGCDGDLGSNEVLLSSKNETYVAIIDGNGTLVDPQGLNIEELRRMAHARLTTEHYDQSLLSSSGFYIPCDVQDFKIPSTGEIIPNGTIFRNKFHSEYLFKYLPKIDIFVPCGGRPGSINLSNLHYYIDPKTNKCRIPYIVEGANLFITQDAKIKLEEHGCMLFKDASANKGGVTSSSMEVLASLALKDDDFVGKFLQNVNGCYDNYVKFIQKKIVHNAKLEFKQLYKINKQTKKPISELSNTLSAAINKLNDDLIDSDELFKNDLPFKQFLLIHKIIPSILFDISSQSHLEVLDNIPENYLKAMLSDYLASNYVYQYGIDVNMGKFLEFIGGLKREAAH
ncbi:hypothetical protein ACO0RG_001000 [Hanseniaspora osmophila]